MCTCFLSSFCFYEQAVVTFLSVKMFLALIRMGQVEFESRQQISKVPPQSSCLSVLMVWSASEL